MRIEYLGKCERSEDWNRVLSSCDFRKGRGVCWEWRGILLVVVVVEASSVL
jgi:hypothetical protein